MAEPTEADTKRAQEWLRQRWPEYDAEPLVLVPVVSLASLLAEVREEAERERDALRERVRVLEEALRDILEDAGDGGTLNRGLNSVQHAEALLAEPAQEKAPAPCTICKLTEAQTGEILGPNGAHHSCESHVAHGGKAPAQDLVGKLSEALAGVLGDLSDAERAIRAYRFVGGMGANIAQEDKGRFPSFGYYGRREKAEALLARAKEQGR